MKFEESYSLAQKRVVLISEIVATFNTDMLAFSEMKKAGFLCPECRTARLSYHNAATPYFSTFPRAAHCMDCSLAQDVMDAQKVNEFVAEAENKEQLVRQINSVMQVLIAENVNDSKSHHHSLPETLKEEKTSKQKSQTYENKRIPRKRIDTELAEDDFGCFKFFYGDVLAQWENDENEYRLLLRSTKEERFLCRIRVSPKVYYHISAEGKRFGKFQCKIVFLAQMKKLGKYPSCKLIWSEYLKIIN